MGAVDPTVMIPVFAALLGDYIVPGSFVGMVMAFVPFRVTPYLAIPYAIALTYVPFGLGVFIKAGAKGGLDNVNPRKQADLVAAQSPLFARLQAAEKDLNEGFPFFAAALLSAISAGVAKDTISLYAT